MAPQQPPPIGRRLPISESGPACWNSLVTNLLVFPEVQPFELQTMPQRCLLPHFPSQNNVQSWNKGRPCGLWKPSAISFRMSREVEVWCLLVLLSDAEDVWERRGQDLGQERGKKPAHGWWLEILFALFIYNLSCLKDHPEEGISASGSMAAALTFHLTASWEGCRAWGVGCVLQNDPIPGKTWTFVILLGVAE